MEMAVPSEMKMMRTVDDRNLEDRKHRLNSYRVLLTRGRDGMIIYIPKEPYFRHTYEFFRNLGKGFGK